ncbi:hypothetical protein CRENBAI_008969 [Crenichthys baileyi]|uniref:Uncharacterized protein n=1 Tax=Crenichthys baileyi TaxID=28760 RepID=A0AAV9RG17_9TELE
MLRFESRNAFVLHRPADKWREAPLTSPTPGWLLSLLDVCLSCVVYRNECRNEGQEKCIGSMFVCASVGGGSLNPISELRLGAPRKLYSSQYHSSPLKMDGYTSGCRHTLREQAPNGHQVNRGKRESLFVCQQRRRESAELVKKSC